MNQFINNTSTSGTKYKLKITTYSERKSRAHPVKMAIFGPPGIGKTRSILTLDHATTLLVDLEAGLLSIQNEWTGDTLSARTWEEARDLACLIGGADPAIRNGQSYSQSHYDKVLKENPDIDLSRYKCLFIDSISKVSNFCFQWAQQQPECNRSGKIDTRAAYGLLGREMIAWVNQLQYIKDKDVIMLGILEQKILESDDGVKIKWGLQCEGSKTANELPGIVDELICLVPKASVNKEASTEMFVCNGLNPQGYPAKDRSGKLNMYEEYHLGNILKKIKAIGDDMFVFQSNGGMKKLTLDEVLPYLDSISKTLNNFEKIEKFKQWTADNHETLTRFYEKSPEYKGHIEHLIATALEDLENKGDSVVENLVNLTKKVK